MRRGNKQNSILNGEWGNVKGTWKKLTSSIRRQVDKKIIKEELEDAQTYKGKSVQERTWVKEYQVPMGWHRSWGKYRTLSGARQSTKSGWGVFERRYDTANNVWLRIPRTWRFVNLKTGQISF